MLINYRYSSSTTSFWVNTTMYHARPCFGSSHETKSSFKLTTYKIYWPRQFNAESKQFCWLTYNEIVDYMNELSEIIGFELISVSLNKTKYEIQLCMPRFWRWNLFINTHIRYLYEYPHSLSLLIAVVNRDKFPDWNIADIFTFFHSKGMINSYSIARNGYIMNHMHPKCKYNSLWQSNYTNHTLFDVSMYNKYDHNIQYLQNYDTKTIRQWALEQGEKIIKNNQNAKESVCNWWK